MWPGRARSPGRVAGSHSDCDRGAPVVGGDAGGGVVAVVDRHEERRALALGVVGDHQREVELGGPLGGDRRAQVARRVVEEERDALRRGELGRLDEVALVLAVLVVDHDEDLASSEGRHGVFDLARTACQESFQASSRSTYLAVTSTSRFTRSPGPLWPRVVTSIVCGMTATVKPSSTGLDHGEADAVDGDRALLDDVAEQAADRCAPAGRGRRSTISPTPSTWPWTRWPPRRSLSRTGRSRFTRCPGSSAPSAVRA